jgi:ribonuclease P protein component
VLLNHNKLFFSRQQRLLNSSAYKRVFDDVAAKAGTKHMVLLARPNNEEYARLGVVVSKKNVRLAVNRNRVKRIVRESFRLKQSELAGFDIVIIAKQGIDTQSESLWEHTEKVWKRLIDL